MRDRQPALICGILGPVAFVGCWVAGGLLRPGYSPVSEAISQLARQGTPHRGLMTAGFVAFGLLMPVYARALVPMGKSCRLAVAASGLATLAVAFLPLSRASGQPVDSWHAVAAGTGYVAQVLAPLLGARRLPAPGVSYAIAAVSLVCLIGSVSLPDLTGLLQRTGLTVVDIWYAVLAVHLLRRRTA